MSSLDKLYRKQPRNWWNAPAGKVNTFAIPYVRTVENVQAETFDKFVKLAAAYDTNPRTNRYTNARDMATRLGRAKAIVTENLIATNVDTVAANVADSDVRVRVQTDGATWSAQRRAKWLERYGEKLAKLHDVGQKCRTGFKAGAAIKGTGVNKVWIDQFDQIRVDPVPIDNVVVDELECRDGNPRHLHYRDFVDRDELMAQFPDFADKIERAQREGNWRLWAGYRPIQSNEVVVIESWRLPIGPKDHPHHVPGRHTIVIDGVDLLDEVYEKPRFPFSKMVWNAPIWGFYGISLAERLMPHQNLLNRRNYQVNRSLDLKADPVTYVHQADQNIAVRTVNQLGAIAVYRGPKPPETVDHQAVGAETYRDRDQIPVRAANEAGVNAAMTNGGVPAGIETGAGVREVRTTRTQRFSIQEGAFEQFWLDTLWLIFDCCKDLGLRGKAPDVMYTSEYGSRRIKWGDVDMGDLKVQLATASTLSDTPAGRQQRITELTAAGIITVDESRELMEHPDITSILSLYNSTLEAARDHVERILDGEHVTPTPYMNLDVCVKVAQQTYNKIDIGEDRGGAPEDVLEALSDFIAIAAAMLNPPQVPGAPTDQTAMPAGPGMPAGPSSAPTPGAYGQMSV